MRKPWHKERPESLARIEGEVLKHYPTLSIHQEEEFVYVRGIYPLVDEGKTLDEFSIEIELPRYDPDEIPVLREVGGRIPRTEDYHVNGPSGDVCLFVPDERWRIYPRGSTLLDFLNVPVRNYFIGFCLVEMGEPWPFGQREHGVDGIFEYYGELLGTDDRKEIVRYVECLSRPQLKGHWECPCGSGERIRNCHWNFIGELREKIPSNVAKNSLMQLRLRIGGFL